MIEVHDRPDAAIRSRVRSFLDDTEGGNGHYGECDPAWLVVLQRSLGHAPFILVSRNAAGIVDGYLPLARVHSLLFGTFLVSLPYVTHAGVIAACGAVESDLRDRAVALADTLDVDHLEVRSSTPSGDERFSQSRTDKVRMTRPLPSDPIDLWSEFTAKVRNQIRKGENQGFTLRFDRHPALSDFHDTLSENMRDLGSPVHPRRFFSDILDAFPAESEIAVVERNGRSVAAALLIHGVRGLKRHRATTVPAASCRRAARPSNANMWMYHQLMLRATARGSAEFDFGRSTVASGPHRFKRQWGAQPIATHWEYYVRRGEIGATRADDPRHSARIALWKRLPVPVTRILGPRIVRGIP